MIKEKMILELVEKNGGFVTSKEVAKNGINSGTLTRMVKGGVLERISRGYYGISGYIDDDFYKVQAKSKNSVYSLATALYLHNLSDRTPLVLNVTVPYDYHGTLKNEPNVSLNFVSRDILNLGVIEIISPFGMKIKVYDVEKTICDIVKNRKKVDAEIFSNALKEYVKLKDKDLRKLVKYAKEMKIEDKIRDYMGLLL
jgi:Predicted transcriptional regulator